MKHVINVLKLYSILIALDIPFLYMMQNYFSKLIANVQKSQIKFKVLPALLCYIFMAVGLYGLVINTNLKNKEMKAALLGLCIYGVYECTNKASFKDWPYEMLVGDTLWGGLLLMMTCYVYIKLNY